MTALKSAPSDDRWRGRFLLCAILAVAAALRLWRLETPSLWFDEALVAMVAKLPVAAVVSRVMESDIHPPFFHLLTKFFITAGHSDAALRLPCTLAGFAGVWLCWRTGRALASEKLGLSMAAACAVLPWQVLLSRQLRPYAMVFFFCLLSFYLLARAVRTGRVRDAALAGAALGPSILLYYGTMMAAGGAGCILLASWGARRTGWRHIAAFAAALAGPVLAVLPFLAAALGHEQGVANATSRIDLAVLCLEKLGHLLFREHAPWVRLALAALAMTGVARLWRLDRLLALVSLGWIIFPLGALVALGYGSYFNPWHLTFLTPVLLLWLGAGLTALPALTAPAVLCAGALFFTEGKHSYYDETSYGGESKPLARQLAASHAPGTAYVYPESAVSGPLNWYLDRFTDPNPLRAQRLGPEDAKARLVVPGTSAPARIIPREPVIPMGPLPFKDRITCAPDDFLARVNSLDHVACQPVLENVLIATLAGRTGHAEFVFGNSSEAPQDVTVHFGYANRKPGSRFAAMIRFDGEPWAASFESAGPDTRGHDKLEIRREKPYRLLTVRFELFRDGRSAAFTGDDLEAVLFLDFKVEATPGK